MKTIRDWLEFLKDDEPRKFALQMKNGLSAKHRYYQTYAEITSPDSNYYDYLDEVIVDMYYNNYIEDGVAYTLFIIHDVI